MVPFRTIANLRVGAQVGANYGIKYLAGSPADITNLLYSDSGSDISWNGSKIAMDPEVVHLGGDETITGVKTFGDGLGSMLTEWRKSSSGTLILAMMTEDYDRHSVVIKDQELGADTGANLYFATYHDDGSLIDYPLQWERASGGLITVGGSTKRNIYYTGHVGFGISNPTSHCHIGGSLANGITTTTSDLTLTDLHNTIYCNNTADIILKLPDLTLCYDREYTIIKGGSGIVIINDSTSVAVMNLFLKEESVTLANVAGKWKIKQRAHLSIDSSGKWESYSEFMNALIGSDFTQTVSGGTVTAFASPDTSHTGVIQLSTGTAINNRAAVNQGITSILLGNGVHIHDSLIYLPLLSTASQEYNVRVGLHDNVAGLPVDGVYFDYTRTVSTNWRINTSSNSIRTTTITTVPVVQANWVRLRIEIYDTSQANFYIDDVFVGSIALNLPVAANRQTGHQIHIIKIAAAAAVTSTMLVDNIYTAQFLRTAR